MAHTAPLSPAAPGRALARLEAALDEQKRSFLRMVSHELRTPLNSILGFSEILTQELYGELGAPQYKEYAGIIHGSGQKLLRLVNQVLEIARLEGRAVDFDAQVEPLEPAIDDTLAMLRTDLAAHDVCVLVIGRGELPSVLADARGLRSVLFNILHNAIVFSPEGGQVRVSVDASHAGEIEIVVEDEGEGVDPSDLPRLMGPFQQGENALTRRGEGAGLGLPIADLTCKAMGGRLRLQCEPGRGVRAHIRLPAG